MTTLAGKVALVTGGSGSIGGAIAERLATSGTPFTLFATQYLQLASLRHLSLRECGGHARALAVDASGPASRLRSAARAVTSEW